MNNHLGVPTGGMPPLPPTPAERGASDIPKQLTKGPSPRQLPAPEELAMLHASLEADANAILAQKTKSDSDKVSSEKTDAQPTQDIQTVTSNRDLAKLIQQEFRGGKVVAIQDRVQEGGTSFTADDILSGVQLHHKVTVRDANGTPHTLLITAENTELKMTKVNHQLEKLANPKESFTTLLGRVFASAGANVAKAASVVGGFVATLGRSISSPFRQKEAEVDVSQKFRDTELGQKLSNAKDTIGKLKKGQAVVLGDDGKLQVKAGSATLEQTAAVKEHLESLVLEAKTLDSKIMGTLASKVGDEIPTDYSDRKSLDKAYQKNEENLAICQRAGDCKTAVRDLQTAIGNSGLSTEAFTEAVQEVASSKISPYKQGLQEAKSKLSDQYDVISARKTYTNNEATQKLDKAFNAANKNENLSSVTHQVDVDKASETNLLWLHDPQDAADLDAKGTKRAGALEVGHATLTNWKKKPYKNEDRDLATEIKVKIGGKEHAVPVAGIFDGHGMQGTKAPEFVKQNIANHLQGHLNAIQEPLDDAKILHAIRNAFVDCHNAFVAENPTIDSGTTATLFLVLNGSVWVANVGDSRAVLIQPGKNPIALTEDSSPEVEKFQKRVEKRGGEVVTGNQGTRVAGAIAVASAIGDPTVEGLSALPQVIRFPLEAIDPNAIVVMGCDGVFDSLSTNKVNEKAQGWMKENRTTEDMADRLVTIARNADSDPSPTDGKPVNQDDITAQVIRLGPMIPSKS